MPYFPRIKEMYRVGFEPTTSATADYSMAVIDEEITVQLPSSPLLGF
jgi:hypothetical protein